MSWQSKYSGDGGGTDIDPFNPAIAYISANSSRIKVTYSMGNYSGNSISQLNAQTHRPPIFCAPHQEELVYFGGDDRFTRVDFSQNPDEKISLLEGEMLGRFRGLAFSRSNPDIAYAVSEGVTWGNDNNLPQKTVWKSTDNGYSWVDISLNNYACHWYGAICTAVDPNDANRVFTGHAGLPTNPLNPRRVMLSEDGGTTWTTWDDGLPLLPINDLEIQEGNSIMYAGTDVGVYYRALSDVTIANGGDGWQCFNDGLPVCLVSDLDIINCSQELVIASFGRGVWKTNLLPVDDVVISQDTDWDTNQNIHANVIIQDGAKLTITSEVNMAAGKSISVLQGCELIVDGGLITNACDEAWRGIHVEGDPSGQYSNDNPGKATLKNGATIEHASTALNNFLYDNGPNYNSTGGYLRVQDSDFLNNIRDVQFLAYDNESSSGNHTNDLSYFYNSHFTIDDDYPFDGNPEANFTSWRCNGMRLLGCTFEDERSSVNQHLRRTGILLGSSTARIKEYCIFVNSDGTCWPGTPNTFDDLSYGIRSYGTTHPLFLTEVKDNEFISCWTGVYLLNSERAEIWQNTFEVTPSNYSPVGKYIDWPVGIYLHNQTKFYTIEDNEFYPELNSTDPSLGQHSFGIIAHTGWGGDEELYKNSFKHLSAGVQSIDKNRDFIFFNNTGVNLKCNDFDRSWVDISIVSSGSSVSNKGLHVNQGSMNAPALNTFNLDIGLKNTSNELIPSDYYHLNYYFDQSEPTSENPVHSYYDQFHNTQSNPQNITVTGTPNTLNEGCITVQGGGSNGGHKSSRQEAQSEQATQENLMLQMLDGGDTEGLQSDVQLTTDQDAWEKYLLLMNEAGYVTESVLEELANKEDGFSLAMIRNVLVANPHSAKSKEVMEELEQRTTQMPEYMMAQIKAGLSQMSQKEYLQMIRDKHSKDFSYHTKAIYHNLIRDSLPPDSLFELVNILEATGSREFDYAQVAIYDAIGNPSLAVVKLDLMSQNPEMDGGGQTELARYVELRQTLLQWGEAVIRERNLNGEALEYLADMSIISDRAGGIAKGYLADYGMLDIDYPVIIPEEVEKRLRGKDEKDGFSLALLSILPNPASNHITVQYRLDSELYEKASFSIVDVRGIVRHEQEITVAEDQLLINITLESGSYQCQLVVNKESIASTQLVIQK